MTLQQVSGKRKADELSEDESTADEETCLVTNLPDEIPLQFLKFLDIEHLLHTVPRVCRQWKRLACERSVWVNAELDYPTHEPTTRAKFIFYLNKACGLKTLRIGEVNPADKLLDAKLDRDLKLVTLHCAIHVPALPNLIQLNRLTLQKVHMEDSDYMSKDPELVTQEEVDAVENATATALNGLSNIPKIKELTLVHLFTSRYRFPPRPYPSTLITLDLWECHLNDEVIVDLLTFHAPTLKIFRAGYTSVSPMVARALGRCLQLEECEIGKWDNLPLLENLVHLKNVQINKTAEPDGNIEIMMNSTVLPRLEILSMDGVWEDAVLSALLAKCTNLREIVLRELGTSVHIMRPLGRLGSGNEPVMLTGLINGAMPRLEVLDLGGLTLRDVEAAWQEHIETLKQARPSLRIC